MITLDYELTQPRQVPINPKVCQEQIDQYAAMAREIMDRATKEDREPTETEARDFDAICDTIIPAWKNELAVSEKYCDFIRAESLRRRYDKIPS